MDFEIWTDKNGTQWKVAEMTTRQIKKASNEVWERLHTSGIFHPYWLAWGGVLEGELERRKRNESKN